MATKKSTAKKQEETPQQNSNEETSTNDAMVSLGGLWLNRDKNGKLYFSGYLGNAKLMIFKNERKEKDNQPDYYMMLANNRKQQATANDLEEENDDIPF